MSLLHHKYTMELFELNAKSLSIEMADWYDHSLFATSMSNLRLYDVTNYPYTVSPKKFYDIVSKNEEPPARSKNEMIICNQFEFELN